MQDGVVGTLHEWLESVKLGEPGKSAYESAVEGGYEGTEEEFNSTLNIKPIPVADIQAIYDSLSTNEEETTEEGGE